MLVEQQGSGYPSDLTASEWEYIKDFLPQAKSVGRPRKTDLKNVINAILYLNRSGCAWRYLPREYPPWQTVYRYFRKLHENKAWQTILVRLVQRIREAYKKSPDPSLVIIDAQSVRAHYGEERGYDGFKKVRGRKREIMVDSLGLVLSCSVHRADQGENRRAIEAVYNYRLDLLRRPKMILGDSVYEKIPFDVEVFRQWRIWPTVTKTQRSRYQKADMTYVTKVNVSNLKPRRWIVERSFAWMNNFRRLSRDYERKIKSSEAQIYICALQLALRKLRNRLDKDF